MAVWREALAPEWPVLPLGVDGFRSGYVAERDGRAVGLVVVAVGDGQASGSIPFVAVVPAERRRGVATRLIERALADLRARGVGQVGAGSGAPRYVWPGAPLDRPDAVALFDALGWQDDGVVTDLVLDLRGDGLVATPAPDGFAIGLAPAALRPAILAFEEAQFPHWSGSYRSAGDDEIVVVTAGGGGEIAGTLLVEPTTTYRPMLGDDAVAIGCVGVAPAYEGRGIGSAMVAYGSRVQRQGCESASTVSARRRRS